MFDRAANASLLSGLVACVALVTWRLSGRRLRSWLRVGAPALILLLIALPLTYRLSKARTMQLGGRIVARAAIDQPLVALTFDDGPSPEGTDAVLPILSRYDVQATFFVVGHELAQYPEDGQRIVAAGNELGNHTYSHSTMIGRPLSFIEREVEDTDVLIRQAGYQGEIYFRPPGCKKLLLLPLYLWRTGCTSVTFDVEPESYPEVARDGDRIAAFVLDRARPGSIILLHPMYGNRAEAVKALPQIIGGSVTLGGRLRGVRTLALAPTTY